MSHVKPVTLNIQGLARRDPDLMRCLLFDEGKVGFSADLSSGEPTVTSHYSGDQNYTDANFNMVGKQPYYNEQGILKISDMYLTGASVAPTGERQIRELFNTRFGTVPFAEQWVIDDEVIKGDANVKPLRNFHKVLILAMQYGQSPKGMVKGAYEKSHTLALRDAREFHHNFWYKLFPKVRVLGERLEQRFSDQGCLINDFGFRMIPDQERKCLNYFIQSTVSGIMNVLCLKFFNAYEHADFISIIHDEVCGQVGVSKVDECARVWQQAVDSLNEDLGWSVKIRSGFVTGETFYDAK